MLMRNPHRRSPHDDDDADRASTAGTRIPFYAVPLLAAAAGFDITATLLQQGLTVVATPVSGLLLAGVLACRAWMRRRDGR